MKKIILLLAVFAFLAFTNDANAQQVEKNLVVVEIGTGTWCGYCPGAAMGADDLVENGHSVAIIENHNGDDYANTGSNARNNYYAIDGYPTAFFNGGSNLVGGSSSSSVYPSYLPLYNTEIAVMSDFTLDMEYTNDGLNYDVTINVDEVADYAGTDLKVHLVLTESHIPESWLSGLEELNFVNRGMYPTHTGTVYTGGAETVNISFTADASYALEFCEIVAFIQDDSTKEILQAQKMSLAQTEGVNNAGLFAVDAISDQCSGVITPSIKVKNYGSDAITSFVVNYDINSGATTGTYSWSGDAFDSFDLTEVTLDEITFDLLESNTIAYEITEVNGVADEDTSNNTGETSFGMVTDEASYPVITVEIMTDNYGGETSWELINIADGSILDSVAAGTYSNNTLYTKTIIVETNGCYQFSIHDSYGDGICCAEGAGYYNVSSGEELLFTGGNFGTEESKGFGTPDVFLANDELHFAEAQIYPNPASTQINIENAAGLTVTLFDVLGREVYRKDTISVNEQINVANLVVGTYMLKLSDNIVSRTEKIVIVK